MNKKKALQYFFTLCLILLISVPFVMAGGRQERPDTEKIVLRAVSFGPLSHINASPLDEFITRINKEAAGELEIRYLGAGEVTPVFEQGEALRSGVFDLLLIFPAAYAGMLPIAGGVNLGDLETPEWRQSGAHDFLVDEHKNIGMQYLGSFAAYEMGSYIYFRDRVEKPEDLKGLRFSAGPTNLLAIEAWGGGGVRVDLAEKYSSLERGIVDGTAGVLESHYNDSLYEVTSYWLPYSLGSALTSMLVNLNKWNSLPEHLQKLFVDTMIDLEKETVEKLRAHNQVVKQKLQNEGMEIIEFSPADAERFLDVSIEAQWKPVRERAGAEKTNRLMDMLNR